MLGDSKKHILLGVTSLASFLVPYTVSSLNVALPAISASFDIDAVMLGWVTSAYLLTAAIFIVPFGKLSDMFGRKRFFILGNCLFAAGSLIAAMSWSGTVIILARIIQALGGAMVFSTSIAIVTTVFPPGERGRAIGIITATVYAGLSLGPFIGGILTHNIGWPSIFLLNIPLALIVIALTVLYIPEEWAESGNRRFDLPGALPVRPDALRVYLRPHPAAVPARYHLDDTWSCGSCPFFSGGSSVCHHRLSRSRCSGRVLSFSSRISQP